MQGLFTQLWVSRLRADRQAFIRPKNRSSGLKLGKGTKRAGMKGCTVYDCLARRGGGGGGDENCFLRKAEKRTQEKNENEIKKENERERKKEEMKPKKNSKLRKRNWN